MEGERETPTETQGALDTPITEEFDMDLGAAELAEELGFGTTGQEHMEEDDEDSESSEEDITPTPEAKEDDEPELEAEAEIPEVDETFFKSWGKDKADLWATASPELQEQIKLRETQMLDGLDQYKENAAYGNTLKDTFAPYENVMKEAGVEAPQVITHLMNAHMKLSYGTKESITAAYEQLGKDIGVIEKTDAAGQPLTPEMQNIQNELNTVKQALTTQQSAAAKDANTKAVAEVNAFADENPYFDEVAEDVALYVNSGLELKVAYEKAVWANPVTRQKEQDRISKETEAASRKKADKDAKSAKKAKSNNVNSRHTDKAPTETIGKMFDDEEMDNVIANM